MATYFNSISVNNQVVSRAAFTLYSSTDSKGKSVVGMTYGQIDGYSPTGTKDPAASTTANPNYILPEINSEGLWSVVIQIDFNNFDIGYSSSGGSSNNSSSSSGGSSNPTNSSIKIYGYRGSTLNDVLVDKKGTGTKYIIIGTVNVKANAPTQDGADITYSYTFNQYYTGNLFTQQSIYLSNSPGNASASTFFADPGTISVQSKDKSGFNYNNKEGVLNIFNQNGAYVILDQKGKILIGDEKGGYVELSSPPDSDKAGWRPLQICDGSSTKTMYVFGTLPK